jgi:hypothetical protein
MVNSYAVVRAFELKRVIQRHQMANCFEGENGMRLAELVFVSYPVVSTVNGICQ